MKSVNGRTASGAAPDGLDDETRAAHAESVYTLADAMLRWGLRLSVPLALLTIGVATVTAGALGLVGSGFGVVLGFGSLSGDDHDDAAGGDAPAQALMGLALGATP